MSNEINLLANKRGNTVAQYQTARKANIVAMSFLAVVIILSVLSFYLNRTQIVTLDQENSIISSQISQSQQKIITLLLVKDRLHQITNILKSHNSFNGILSDIISSLPSDVHIDTFSINKKKLSVTFSSQSLFSLQQVFSSAQDMLQKKNFFNKITVNSLVEDTKTGEYIFFIEADVI